MSSKVAKLHPQESSHRASRIATDMAVRLAMELNTLSEFLSKEEMFHLEMQMLYVLIDLMGTTSRSDPEMVVEQAKRYFQSLRREKNEANE